MCNDQICGLQLARNRIAPCKDSRIDAAQMRKLRLILTSAILNHELLNACTIERTPTHMVRSTHRRNA